MNTLYVDIETSPIKAYVWGLWDQNIGLNQIIEPTRMLCVAFKRSSEETQFAAEWLGGHRRMVKKIHDELDWADNVVHFNGKSFDVPHINREFLEWGFTPPSPYKQTDLFITVKRSFKFPSNKLAYIADKLDIDGGKLKVDMDLWTGVLNGDTESRALMGKYAVRDVDLLVELHEMMLPWITQAPNAGLYVDNPEVPSCPSCGSQDLKKNGLTYTGAGAFQTYQCKECGRYSRSAQRTHTTPLREAN